MKLIERTAFVAFGLALIFGGTHAAHAAVLRSGEDVTVSEEQIVPGDFYAAGNDVYIAGVIDGDLYVLGGTVTLKGTVKGDVVALGGTVSIDGDVGDDVRVIGGKVIVSERVVGDVLVVAGSLTAPSSAHIGQDLLFYGEEGVLEGVVDGAFTAHANSLTINGMVTMVDATVSGALVLGPHAQVKKDILYESSKDIVRTPESVVEGAIHKKEMVIITTHPIKELMPIFFMSLFSSLVAVLLFRESLLSIFAKKRHALVVSGIIGLGTFIATPIAVILLCVTVLGAPIGIILFLGYLMAYVGALIVTPVYLGALAAKLYKKQYMVTWVWTLVGVILLHLFLLIPGIGIVAVIACSVLVFGMFVYEIYNNLRISHG